MQDIVAAAKTAKSLADGQRLNDRRNSDRGSASDNAMLAMLRTASDDADGDEMMIEKASKDVLAVWVMLGVVDLVADCVRV